MPKLTDKLPLPDKRDEIVDACQRLLEDEVRKKRGVGGLMVKGGFKVLKAFKPGAVRGTIDALFDEFIEALESHHAEYEQGDGKGSFGSFLQTRAGRIAEDLVGVTDARADKSKHKTLVKAYRKMRPSAVRNVEEAVPGLGALMDRYYQA
jgi:hypothetical protein